MDLPESLTSLMISEFECDASRVTLMRYSGRAGMLEDVGMGWEMRSVLKYELASETAQNERQIE